MTDTDIQREPAFQDPRIRRWRRPTRAAVRTAAVTAFVWFAAGALGELGARLIEWLC